MFWWLTRHLTAGTTVTETVLPETPASLFPLPEMFASEDDASVDVRAAVSQQAPVLTVECIARINRW